MAHKDSAPHGAQGGHGAAGAPGAHAGAAHTPGHDAHAHPTWKQYKWVAVILTAITIVEVWIYYIPSFVASKLFVPALLIMSAVKFAIVVLFYMHLKFDSRVFGRVFFAPLFLAMLVILGMIILFKVLPRYAI